MKCTTAPFFLLFHAALLAMPQGDLPAGGGACLVGTAVTSYRCETIPNTLTAATSIFAGAGATTVITAPADDVTATVGFPVGFVFPFYGASKTSMVISSNGLISFTSSADYNNEHPGDEALGNDCIMPWHDDLLLTTALGGKVGYVFSPLLTSVTVEWNNVSTYLSSAVGHGRIMFQAVLHGTSSPTPGKIEFKYHHLDNFDGDLLVLGAPFGLCAGFTSTYAISATIGLDAASTSALSNHGVEPVDRGAANFYFPFTDIALIPLPFRGTEMDYPAAVPTLVPQAPFCSIVGRIGTMRIGTAGHDCPLTTTCMDDTPAPAIDGTLVHHPFFWKFNLHGRLFQSISVSPNGLMNFGAGQWGSTVTNTVLPGTSEPEATIAPFWDDLEGLCASYGSSAGMFYRVDGMPGCRVLTLEWSHFGRSTPPKADGFADGHISFQVRLFEGSAGSVGPCPLSSGSPLTVLAGVGNDRIEFLYDHATFVPPSGTPFSATIGYENHKGTIGASLASSPSIMAPPFLAGAIPAKVVIEQCDEGIFRTYGIQTPPTCPREILANGVPPRTGNAFALRMSGVTPSLPAFFLFDFGGPLPGLNTPVPCGGIPALGGLLWVSLGPATVVVFGGFTSPSSFATPFPPDCEGGITLPVPIPGAATLVGTVVFAQGVTLDPATILIKDSTTGAKFTIGG